MPKRDYISEILSKKERLSSASQGRDQVWERIHRLKAILQLLDMLEPTSDLISMLEDAEDLSWELRGLEINYGDVRYEVTRYIPIGFVACMEGFFRLAYADLINHGPPFRDNASEFDIKFSIGTAVSLQHHSLSLGEFVAHLLSTNNLADINHNMSTIIGDVFLRRFREMRPKLETRLYLFAVDEEQITNSVLADVQRLFELSLFSTPEMQTGQTQIGHPT